MRNTVLAGLLALALPACLVGTGDISGDPGNGGATTGGGGGGTTGGGGGGDQGGGTGGTGGGGMTPTPKVTGTVDQPTVNTELLTEQTLNYTITGTDGFSGAVTLTPTVVDAQGNPVTGWTLAATPASVTLDATTTSQTVALKVTIPSDNVALSPTVKLALASTAPAAEVDAAFTIKNQVTIAIDAGTGTTAPHSNLPLPNSRLQIHAGTKVIFHNADTIPHRIHADGGIAHEPSDLQPGADYVTTPSSDADWYCHDHESSAQARLVNIL